MLVKQKLLIVTKVLLLSTSRSTARHGGLEILNHLSKDQLKKLFLYMDHFNDLYLFFITPYMSMFFST